jgi:hypothetical protein
VVPAFHYGEKRVLIDEPIGPDLVEGIESAMRILKYWYYGHDKQIPHIETKPVSNCSLKTTAQRSAFFFSGGVDSWATLCANRMRYPLDHPRAISDGILVFGLEQDDPKIFQDVLSGMRTVEKEAGFTLIPVYTNVYLEFRNEDSVNHWKFWHKEFGAAALSAVAHCFSKRVDLVSIGATYQMNNLEPWGSHPLLDMHFSSEDMRIVHDGFTLTRHEKLKHVVGLDVALQHIRVCNRFRRYRKDIVNCGECEKCVRTMLGLLALGALDKTDAFPRKDVTPELVLGKADIQGDFFYLKAIYEEIIPGLLEKKRDDLVTAIQQKISFPKLSSLKRKVSRLDQKYLGDTLAALRRFLARNKTSIGFAHSVQMVPEKKYSERHHD